MSDSVDTEQTNGHETSNMEVEPTAPSTKEVEQPLDLDKDKETPKEATSTVDEDDDVPLVNVVRKKMNSPKRKVVEDDEKKEDDDDVPLMQVVKKEKAADVKKEKETPKKVAIIKDGTPKKTTEKKSTPVKKENTESPAKAAPAKRKREPEKKSGKKGKAEESDSDSSSSSSDSDSDSDSSSSSSDSDSSSSSSSSDSDSSSSSSSSDSDSSSKKKKKTTAKKAKTTPKKETPKKSPKKETTPKKTPKKETPKKKGKKSENDDESPKKKRGKKDEEPEYKWWLEEPLPEGKKWRTLEHNGVLFPPEYKAHGVKMLYNGEPVDLTDEQEELATYFSQYLETDHYQKPQFRKNFFSEFLKVLNPKKKKEKHMIKDFDKCDFTPIHKYLMQDKEERKNRSKEEKDKEKEEKKKVEEKYGVALVDGHKTKISNYKVEPPGLFLGRGNHPKAGMLKKRVMPEDITLNLGKKAPVPPCPLEGHKWGAIVHDDEKAWLAFWKDHSNNFKYVWLAASSRIKGESDMRKFETARKLKDSIDEIRDNYKKDLKSKDTKIRQRATALYVIDRLALRVGNEKDEDEADTVGCCSLRCEHITLTAPTTVTFDFLGKDSMRYHNSVEVSELVFKNFDLFMKGKDPEDDVFDQLTTTALNNHLKTMMEGLTAKVFRTYNASATLERELAKMPEKADKLTVDEKMLFYLRANREVAILCNHQRSVSKNHSEQIGKIDDKIAELEDYKDDLETALGGKKKKKKVEKKKKSDDEDDDEKKKEKKIPDDPDKIKKAIQRVDLQIIKWKAKKTEKDENKAVSLTTSKINYIDPRISVAWAKKWDVPIEKIFSKTLRQKFPWAMDVDEDWTF